jgi:hypothetical protein
MTRTKTRTIRQSLWLTPDEKERWSKKAAAASLSLNEYIRLCVDKRKITAAPPEVNRSTAVELGRIGVNLNQLVRAINTVVALDQEIPKLSEVLNLIDEVSLVIRELHLELLGLNNSRIKDKTD